MQITGTFLDEISHDIPHQNWGEKEWDADFRAMKAIGINTVILIRCGYKRWMTYPSRVLQNKMGGWLPHQDLVKLFLEKAEKYGMQFYFGLYDSGKYWTNNQFEKEVDINKQVIDEVWKQYGNYPAFAGWYISQEISRRISPIIGTYAQLGEHCKAVSEGLPVMISPFIDGQKALLSAEKAISKENTVSLKEHEREWNEILDGIHHSVDILAFQDGHVDFHELSDYLYVNKQLADKYHMETWTNAETFDRDMPIKFLPIKWEKLRIKLEAAAKAGIEKAITFEFSHFMSPHSAYLQARHLFNRYCEHFGLEPRSQDFQAFCL